MRGVTCGVLRRHQCEWRLPGGPSAHPDPDYSATTDFLLAMASDLGLESRVLEFVPRKPELLFTWKGSDPSLQSLLLNSHVDVVPADASQWRSPPFAAAEDSQGNVFARGSQDMKCVGLQYLEAIRRLQGAGFKPPRSVHISFVPDEEIGGNDGAARFVSSREFQELDVGLVLDEGLASEGDEFRVFYAERSPWWLENLIKSLESFGRRSLISLRLGSRPRER